MSTGWHFVVVVMALSASVLVLRTKAIASEDPAAETSVPLATDAGPASETPPPSKYRLAFKFQPNQIVRYEVSKESETTTHVKGETETAKNSSQEKKHFRVIAVDETTGEADLELVLDWVHMLASFNNPARTKTDPIEFQSDDPQKHPPQFLDILSTVGKPRARIRFSTSGKVVKVLAGAPAPQPTAANQLAQGPSAPPANDGSPESFFVPLPEQPVAVGEFWKDLYSILLRDDDKNLHKITIQRSYRLVGANEGRALIEFRTAILTPVPNQWIAGQLIQRELSGKVVFDIDRGLIVSRESGVENTVVGPFGPRSSMHAKSQYREQLVDEEAAAGPSADARSATADK
jgi:hypothetical protein